jgi:hypothetical protein
MYKKYKFPNLGMKFLSDYSFHCPLPLELNCEIYKCLPEPIQTKFIWGLGRGIYGAFRHKLLVKVYIQLVESWDNLALFFQTKRLRNPRENRWIRTETKHSISSDGLTINEAWKYYYSKLAFTISCDCRKEYNNYPGTILYYFEIVQMASSKSDWWVRNSWFHRRGLSVKWFHYCSVFSRD